MFLVGSLGLVYVGFSRWVGVDLKKWWYDRQKLARDIGWGVLGIIIVQILTLVIGVALFMLFFPPEEMLPSQTIPTSVGEVLLMLFFGFAIASFQEETMFRGFLQNVLTEKAGKWQGNVLQAAIFSIAHIGYYPLIVWPLFILAFVLGIVFGWLKMKRGTLIVPGIAHGFFG
jgi:membrane protease YdiL (CAAX protease family)